MNRNEERMMVTGLQEEVEIAKAERDAVLAENAKLLAWAKEHGYQE